MAGCGGWTGAWSSSSSSGRIDARSSAVRRRPARPRRHLHVLSRSQIPRKQVKDDPAPSVYLSSIWIHVNPSCCFSIRVELRLFTWLSTQSIFLASDISATWQMCLLLVYISQSSMAGTEWQWSNWALQCNIRASSHSRAVADAARGERVVNDVRAVRLPHTLLFCCRYVM